ncbi:unnamed protein product [Trifolium pratense]|uniref:Uncharacterized protein n=1 Tax=Trifolium pratense TaxID=57577 RepID=A0ACB0LEK8_TRIPR|nr:unnamed protein product [Trifolium pratense]
MDGSVTNDEVRKATHAVEESSAGFFVTIGLFLWLGSDLLLVMSASQFISVFFSGPGFVFLCTGCGCVVRLFVGFLEYGCVARLS